MGETTTSAPPQAMCGMGQKSDDRGSAAGPSVPRTAAAGARTSVWERTSNTLVRLRRTSRSAMTSVSSAITVPAPTTSRPLASFTVRVPSTVAPGPMRSDAAALRAHRAGIAKASGQAIGFRAIPSITIVACVDLIIASP
jgi:hypothetical protein